MNYKPVHNKARRFFTATILKNTATRIRANQEKVAQEWNLFRSGKMQKMLQGHFAVGESGTTSNLTMSYVTYARFLDMNDKRRRLKREGYHLYNRIVFGQLYNYTLSNILYGYTDEIHEEYTQQLKENGTIN
jgi:hypothetical protein